MKKNILLDTMLVVIAVVIIAVVAYFYMHRSSAGVSTAASTTTPSNAGLPANPALLGTFDSATQTSVTITLQNGGTQKTFAVSSSTQVVSQVQSGQVGKSLAQITPGAMVLVQPHAVNSLTADRITLMPTPTVSAPNPAGPPASVSGTLLSTTTTSLTIKTATSPSLRVTLTGSTVILTNVLAGQKGKTLADAQIGMYVQVFGIAGKNGPIASSVQLLVPLGQ